MRRYCCIIGVCWLASVYDAKAALVRGTGRALCPQCLWRWPVRKTRLGAMMRKILPASLRALAALVLATAMFGAAPLPSHAQESQSTDRPRIGLVLAGGGAKGGAHV